MASPVADWDPAELRMKPSLARQRIRSALATGLAKMAEKSVPCSLIPPDCS